MARAATIGGHQRRSVPGPATRQTSRRATMLSVIVITSSTRPSPISADVWQPDARLAERGRDLGRDRLRRVEDGLRDLRIGCR